MHILGKVLLWFAVLLIVAAFFLTTMTLDVRSKSLAEVDQRKEKLAKSKEDIRSAKLRVSQLEQELDMLKRDWGDVWNAPNSVPQRNASGLVDLEIGSGSGLGFKANQASKPHAHVHLFNVQGEQSVYAGEFSIEQLQTDRAAMKLVRQPFPQELQTWQPGVWRVRDVLPSDKLATIADIEGQILISSTKLRTQNGQLEIMNSQITESQASLDQRLAELNGDADAPDGASTEVVDGLVQTLRNYESNRDQILNRVNQYRHTIDAEYVKLQKTIAANKQAVQQAAAQTGLTSPANQVSAVSEE